MDSSQQNTCKSKQEKQRKINNENTKAKRRIDKTKEISKSPQNRDIPDVRVQIDQCDILESKKEYRLPFTHSQTFLHSSLPPLSRSKTPLLNTYLRPDSHINIPLSKTPLSLHQVTFDSNFLQVPHSANNQRENLNSLESKGDKSHRKNKENKTDSTMTWNLKENRQQHLPPISKSRQSNYSDLTRQIKDTRENSGASNRSRNSSVSNLTFESHLSQELTSNLTSDDDKITQKKIETVKKEIKTRQDNKLSSSPNLQTYTEKNFERNKLKTNSSAEQRNKMKDITKDAPISYARNKEKIKCKQNDCGARYPCFKNSTPQPFLRQIKRNNPELKRSNTTAKPRFLLKSPGHLFKKHYPQTDRISTMKTLVNVSESVGVICCGKSFCGTGFMVGRQFVLTAFHVVRSMLGLMDCNIFEIKQKIEECLKKTPCSIIFNKYHDDEPNRVHFHIEHKVPYYDQSLDVILLEMKENFGISFPVPLKTFGDIQQRECFHFIGHPNGQPKERDAHCFLLDISNNTVNDLKYRMRTFLRANNSESITREYGDPYHGIVDPNKCFFNCAFEHAASGSPGITVDNNGKAKTCIMLLGGYPTFYWDCSEEIKIKMPEYLRFEFGVRLSAVYRSMKRHNESLCDDVFINHTW